MSDFLEAGLPGIGGLIGREKLRQKTRKVVIGNMFEHDGSRRRPEGDDGDEIDLQDPNAKGYRHPQQGERPSKRAQWDDVRGCWVEWSRATNDWVVVGDVAHPEGAQADDGAG